MKLSEIKKCKVPELRAKLKELGLDPKGLKTELIGRLWSALEAGLQIDLQSNRTDRDHDTTTTAPRAEDVATRHDTAAPPSPATEGDRVDVTSTSPAVATMTTPSLSTTLSTTPSTSKEYADTATQTDACSPTSTRPEGGSGPGPTAGRSDRLAEPRSAAAVRTPAPEEEEEKEEDAAARRTGPGVCEHSEYRWADSIQVPVSQDQEEGEGEDCAAMAGDSAAGSTGAMGRAFYEFKEEIRYKRAKVTPPSDQKEGEVVEEDDKRVRIDTYASDLHFEVDRDGSCGRPLFRDRFPLLWSGCRLTHGVQWGTRTCFEVRLEGQAHASAAATAGPAGEKRRPESRSLRVGWAPDNCPLPLGEDELSYAYDGRGRKVSGGKAEEFGEPLSDGDIIGCYLLFSTDGTAEISFHKNGRPMGLAFRLSPSRLQGQALFPHVLCQGCSVRFHLDPGAGPWYPGPPGYTPLVALPVADRVHAPAGPSSRTECEVIMMVGLPGSGKSHWARILMEQHPEKQYQLLGTETLLASMIGVGQRERKLQQASLCLTELIKMAARKPGNYILDQPNVFLSARRHKLQLFGGYQRRLLAVVFPPMEEWRRRLGLQQAQDGERIPDTALLKLQVSYSLPEQQGEPFEELRYMELPQEEAQVLLHTYREEARRLLPPVPKPQKKARIRNHRAFGQPPSQGNQWKRRYDQGYYYNTGAGYSGYQSHW
ncbi:unnamed protein product [Merluccius merluccius]